MLSADMRPWCWVVYRISFKTGQWIQYQIFNLISELLPAIKKARYPVRPKIKPAYLALLPAAETRTPCCCSFVTQLLHSLWKQEISTKTIYATTSSVNASKCRQFPEIKLKHMERLGRLKELIDWIHNLLLWSDSLSILKLLELDVDHSPLVCVNLND